MSPDHRTPLPARTTPWVRGLTACIVSGLMGVLVLSASPAHAQAFGEILDSEIPLSTKTGRNQGVLDRYFERLAAQGLPAGGFRIFPSAEAGLGVSSNVLGAEQDARSDLYAALDLQFQARSQWSRHSLTATARYDGRRYFDTPAKNENGYLAQLTGRLDVIGESKVEATLTRRRSYEDQFVGSFPANGAGAIAVDQTTALARATWLANRLRITGSTDYNRLRYSDTITTTGALLPQGFRDRGLLRASARIEYLVTADNALFAQLTYRDTNYDVKSGPNARSSREWRVLGGAIGDVTSLIRVAIGIGYNRRTYDNPALRPLGGLALDARADYFVTELSTVSLIASRKIEEATLLNSSGYIATRFGARVDHELLRNVRLYLNAQVQHDAFGTIGRRDKLFLMGAGANYTLSRNWLLQPRAEYIDRRSEGNLRGPNIKELRAVVSVTARL